MHHRRVGQALLQKAQHVFHDERGHFFAYTRAQQGLQTREGAVELEIHGCQSTVRRVGSDEQAMWSNRPLTPAMLRVHTLKNDAVHFGAGWLAETLGRGFLVVHSGKGAVGPLFRTRNVDPSAEPTENTGSMDIGVMPLSRKALSANPFVCIGRLDGNDVALPDDTVSKLHAMVREDQRGVLTILDARSKNGTWLDGALVPARGEGEAMLLKSGQTLRFGSVTTTYYDAIALYEMCLQFN